jgi:hypothetical protein
MYASGLWHFPSIAGTSLVFQYKHMTKYQTGYRDPNEQQWMNGWASAGAKMRRAGIEKRFAPRKIEIGSSALT